MSPDNSLYSVYRMALFLSCSLSCVCCVVVIATFLYLKALRRHPNSLVIARCVCDLLFYMQFVVSEVASFVGITDKSDCQFLGFYTQYFVLASELYFMCLSIDMRRTLSNPFTNYKLNTRMYHGLVLFGSSLFALVVSFARFHGESIYGADNYLTICWIRELNRGKLHVNPFTWALFYVPLCFIFFTCIILLYQVRQSIARGVSNTARLRLNAFRKTLQYVVVLFPYWMLTAALLFATQRIQNVRALEIMFAIVFGARDVIVLVVWFWTNDINDAMRLKRSRNNDTVKDIDLSPAFNNVLKQEIMLLTSLGIQCAVRHCQSAARSSHMDDLTPSVRPFDVNPESTGQKMGKLTLRKVLAGELPPLERTKSVPDVGTVKAKPEQKRTSSDRTLSAGKGAGVALLNTTRNAARNVKNAMKGKRKGSRRLSAPLLAKIDSAAHIDTSSKQAMDPESLEANLTSLEVSARNNTGQGGRVKGILFRDFDAGTFHQIRVAVGVDDEQYINALKETTNGNFSGGSSGAFMYFTKSKEFIVKTLTRGEVAVLRSLVHDYYHYIRKSPNTLLTKFLGCYSMQLYGKTIYFTVMTNILLSPDKKVHDVYDLKGSRVNRSVGPPAKGSLAYCKHCNTNFRVGKRGDSCPARLRHPHVAVQTLKDNDLKFKLRLGRKRDTVLAQIMRDADFLKSKGIMDYSLLLGVHQGRFTIHKSARRGAGHSRAVSIRRGKSSRSAVSTLSGGSTDVASPKLGQMSTPRSVRIVEDENELDYDDEDEETKGDHPAASRDPSFAYIGPSLLTQYHGGLKAARVEGPEVYFMGIIDILQRWTTAKRVERWFKTRVRCQDRDGISAVPPEHYHKRFVRWIRHEVVEGNDSESSDSELSDFDE